MPTLHIQLLGDFRLILDDKFLTTVVQARMQCLLAYLLLHRDTPVPRKRIAFLFWPETAEHQAQTNLRQLLYRIRRALPESDQYLQIETKTVQWRPDAFYILDVADFEHDLSQATIAANEGHSTSERTALESAIHHYAGDLLAGYYDEWILPERERLSQAFVGALERLILLAEAHRDYRPAIRHAERLLRHDPLHEKTYQRLMRLYALNGDRASALRIYHTCVTTMASELGIEPNHETQEAYLHLLNSKTTSTLHSASPSMTSTRSILVGRHNEWHTLHKDWRRAVSGQPKFVVITGEAGIGKTRLAEGFLEWAAPQGIIVAGTRSYAAEGQLAYAFVIELFRTVPLFTRLSRLEDVWLTELARLMPELFAERPDLPKPEPINDPWQRQRLFEALARAVYSDKRLLVLLLDDLQWCDQDTLEWLRYLLHFDPRGRLLIIGGVRPEEVGHAHPLTSLLLDLRLHEQVTEIELGPLNASETTALAEQVAGKKLTAEQAAQLYRYTEGNPLFVVETIRAEGNGSQAVLQIGRIKPGSNQLPLSSTKMPAKIQAIIQARLRQLSPHARDLVRHAASIGRAFSSDVLAQASECNEETLVQGLDELWRRRIVREQGGNVYYFSHDRIREVAYDEISSASRKLLHRRAASALEKVYAAELDPVSGQIAVHYDHAGEFALAVAYYQRAVGVAQQTFSNAEVVDLISRALTLLPLLPDTNERRRTELNMLITLGTAQMLIKGVGHSEAEKTFLRAWNLYQLQGEQDQAIPALAGLCLCYHLRGDQTQAQYWAEQLKLEVHTMANPLFRDIVQLTLTGATLFSGGFIEAQRHAEQGFARHGPDMHRYQIVSLGYNPGISILGYWSLSFWFLGYPNQARIRMKKAISLAKILRQPMDIGFILSMNTILHQLCDEVALTLDQAAASMEYAREKGLQQWIIHGRILFGWAIAQRGQTDQGYEQVRQGIVAWKSMGARLALTYYLLLLAETCTISGQVEEGLKAVSEALAIIHTGGESWMEAELYRRQGGLLLVQGADEQEVEACYQRALEIARLQQARSFELRAAMSVSRLWRLMGKDTDARNLLNDIYSWFSEGFDTADLRQAKHLLDTFR